MLADMLTYNTIFVKVLANFTNLMNQTLTRKKRKCQLTQNIVVNGLQKLPQQNFSSYFRNFDVTLDQRLTHLFRFVSF